VEKEASETLYWLELMLEGGIGANQEAIRLMQEAKQLLAIFTVAGRTSKKSMISDFIFEIRISKSEINQLSIG
jgi:hypothetical protein